jgi:hypothetical protein
MADRALVGARKVRRQRGILASVGAFVLTGAVAVPWLAGGAGPVNVPLGSPSASVPTAVTPMVACKTFTHGPGPLEGAPLDTWADFVPTVLGKLPARSDYTVQSGYGICTELDGTPVPAQRPVGRVNINLGANAEHGHVSLELYRDIGVFADITCATLPSPHPQSPFQDLLYCQDATGDTPMVVAYGGRQLGVSAIYSDGRAILTEATGTPFGVEVLRAVVTDPELAALVS